MRNVSGLSLVVGLVFLSACGRQTTTTYWNGSAWVSTPTSSSGSSAATAAASQIYAVDGNGSVQLFSITIATGNLVLISVSTTPPSGQVQQIVTGPWTYKVNVVTNAIDLYSSDNMNVIVQSFTVATGITAIAVAK